LPDDRLQKLQLWLVAVGFFMKTLDSTIVNTALSAMAPGLNESPLSMYSVVIADSLTFALLIPASGWISDKFGVKKVFFSAIVILSLGSLLCALSQSLPMTSLPGARKSNPATTLS
jgi:MFS family permease